MDRDEESIRLINLLFKKLFKKRFSWGLNAGERLTEKCQRATSGGGRTNVNKHTEILPTKNQST